MKNKYILISAASVLLALSAVFGFTNKPASGGILTVRTVEIGNGLYASSIFIIDENGKLEIIELKKLQSKDYSQNMPVINQTLNKIKAAGYRLISTAGGGDGFTTILNTYTFEKE